MAGYSGTPLQQKLGLKERDRVAFTGPMPEGFPGQFAGLDVRTSVRAPLDAVVMFAEWRGQIEPRAVAAGRAVFPSGMVWIAWPKKASNRPTDITEDVLREVLLPTGLVDTKVCAIDEVWSGLRFVWRKERRAPPP